MKLIKTIFVLGSISLLLLFVFQKGKISPKSGQPAPSVAPICQESTTGEKEAVAEIDLFLKPEGKKVGYFVPGQTFVFSGEEEGEYLEIVESVGHRLWIKKDASFKSLIKCQ